MEAGVEPAGQRAEQPTGAAGPLPAELVLGATPVLKEPRLLGGRLFWLEQLPAERGRTTLRLRGRDGREWELTPELDLRSRIHGYGGGVYSVAADTAVVVAEGGRSLWRLDLPGAIGAEICCDPQADTDRSADAAAAGSAPPLPADSLATALQAPVRLTPATAGGGGEASGEPALFGDGLIDLARRRWIGVCEQDGRDRLVSVPLDGGAPRLLWQSPDFCGYAVLSPSASHLAWVSWRQPCMPWERSQLWLGRFDAQGELVEARPIAGSAPGDAEAISVFQPLWAGADLVVANDRNGWWNLELLENAEAVTAGVAPAWRPLLPLQADFAMPQWVYGMRTTAWDGHQLLAAACVQGRWQLGALLPIGSDNGDALGSGGADDEPAAMAGGAPDTVPGSADLGPTTAVRGAATASTTSGPLNPDRQPGRARMEAPGNGASAAPPAPLHWQLIPLPFDDLSALDAEDGRLVAVVSGPQEGPGLLELETHNGRWAHRPAAASALAPEQISVPEPLWFAGHGGLSTHAWYYPPRGGATSASPLLVRGHSGPTAMARTGLSLQIQYWTSRGWGVVDVNYGGSTGFGRAYRERLDGGWGVVDVDDCLAAARAVVDCGRADPDRIAMEGSSASGFTVLAAMARDDTIKAGAIRYPVTDLSALAEGDHRFEARYFDTLVGPWPQARALYEQRSPLNQVDRIHAPLLFFHGLEDSVVPAQQSIVMVERLRLKGVPVELELFEGEGHGFRDASVQRRVLERSEAFFRERFGLREPA